jgi:hypothetical protein
MANQDTTTPATATEPQVEQSIETTAQPAGGERRGGSSLLPPGGERRGG